ncbi:MAG: hydrogenase iron-sulfur subunit [Deltaproteobacteria bacterium]|nr:hydrogenase iron-sulfur subunit [Deltaproteobacteria bacterium]
MEYNPNVVCFSCKFGWGYVSEKKPEDDNPQNWIPVVCSGKVETTHILEAFRAGADGVLILACQEGHCHYQDGNFQTGKKVYLLQKVLGTFGIENERVRMELGRNPEGDRIVQLVNEMKQDLSKLGPVRRL